MPPLVGSCHKNISFDDICCRFLKLKQTWQSQRVFLKYYFWYFNLVHKEEEVWPGRTHPMLFAESSCVCMPSFTSVAPFLFSRKKTIFLFLISKGIWPYIHSPGDTHSKYIVLLV